MTRPPRSCLVTILLLLTLPLVLAAGGGDWRELAEHHAAFAKGLAQVQVRYGPEFDSLVQDIVVRCEPIDYKLAGLQPSEARQVRLFCEHLCMPWLVSWASALRPCDQEHVPKWCDDFELAGKHFAFGPYFEFLTTAMAGTSSALERYNIMAVIADRLTTKVLQDYPRHDIDAWVATALAEYLRSANDDDVVSIARELSFNSFGGDSAVAREFRKYAERSTTLSNGQRADLVKFAGHIASKPSS